MVSDMISEFFRDIYEVYDKTIPDKPQYFVCRSRKYRVYDLTGFCLPLIQKAEVDSYTIKTCYRKENRQFPNFPALGLFVKCNLHAFTAGTSYPHTQQEWSRYIRKTEWAALKVVFIARWSPNQGGL